MPASRTRLVREAILSVFKHLLKRSLHVRTSTIDFDEA